MKLAIANMRPSAGEPERMFSSEKGLSERPSGPPVIRMTRPSSSTMPISAPSTMTSTLELSSMWR